MKNCVTLTIDGAGIRASEGASVLDVALEYGICIPHLCHVQNLTPTGVCRLCIVEVVERGKVKVTTSCTLEAAEGMVIRSNTPRIRKLRRNIAELLVAEAPNSRAIQDIAARCGVTGVRYPFRNSSCVLCGRCVRVCGEMWQAKSLGFVGRGERRRVDFPFHRRPASCKRCYSCIDLCPMTITPCPGPMLAGQERLCGQCLSQLSMSDDASGFCVRCEVGKGFHCLRQASAATR